MMAVVIGNKSAMIDFENRKICFGLECIRYKTKEQFDVAYEVVITVAKICEELEKKVEETKICEELVKKVEEKLRKISMEGRL